MTISVATETPQEAGTDQYTKWAIALFFVALFIPGSFYVGIRMTPYRLYLMVMAIPILLRLLNDKTLRITAVDVLMFLALFWQSLAILANHKTAQMVNAVASFGEAFLGYLLARVYIRSASDFRYFFRCFLVTLLAFLPFVLVELFGHRRILRMLFSYVFSVPPAPTTARYRLGFLRAQASFETFLVFGAFCAVGFANVFYVYSNRFPRNIVYAFFVAFMTASAISTSSLLSVFIQTMFILYNAVFRWFHRKWIFFVIMSATPLMFANTIIDFILTEVMFNPRSGESRLNHFKFGLQEISESPIFGIGLKRWDNAWWLSQSVDNFWLALTLRNGIPAALLMAGVFVAHFIQIALAGNLNKTELAYRTGYLISFVATMLMFFTTNFFAVSFVFFMMYCAAGCFFYNGLQEPRGYVGSPAVTARRQARVGERRVPKPVRAQYSRPR